MCGFGFKVCNIVFLKTQFTISVISINVFFTFGSATELFYVETTTVTTDIPKTKKEIFNFREFEGFSCTQLLICFRRGFRG